VVSARSAYSGCFRFSPRYHDIFNPRPRDCELAHRDKNFFVADCFKLRFAGRLRVWLPEILSNGPLVLCDPVKFRLLKRGPRSDRPTPISLSCVICNGVLVDNCRAVSCAGGHRFARNSLGLIDFTTVAQEESAGPQVVTKEPSEIAAARTEPPLAAPCSSGAERRRWRALVAAPAPRADRRDILPTVPTATLFVISARRHSSLVVEPKVFEARAIVYTVDHAHQAFDIGPPAGDAADV
jgi:hypothetical protein